MGSRDTRTWLTQPRGSPRAPFLPTLPGAPARAARSDTGGERPCPPWARLPQLPHCHGSWPLLSGLRCRAPAPASVFPDPTPAALLRHIQSLASEFSATSNLFWKIPLPWALSSYTVQALPPHAGPLLCPLTPASLPPPAPSAALPQGPPQAHSSRVVLQAPLPSSNPQLT